MNMCVSSSLCVSCVFSLALFHFAFFLFSCVFYFILLCSFLWAILNGLNTFNLHPHTYVCTYICNRNNYKRRGHDIEREWRIQEDWRKKSVEWKLGKYMRFLQIIKKNKCLKQQQQNQDSSVSLLRDKLKSLMEYEQKPISLKSEICQNMSVDLLRRVWS